jgi:hypothetical protein
VIVFLTSVLEASAPVLSWHAPQRGSSGTFRFLPFGIRIAPATGWSSQASPPAGGRAARFERSHSAAVQTCDVYWVGDTNPPTMYFGMWLNYFYFDTDEKLIGFDRWVLD